MAGSWGLAYFLEALFILASDFAVKEVNLILVCLFCFSCLKTGFVKSMLAAVL